MRFVGWIPPQGSWALPPIAEPLPDPATRAGLALSYMMDKRNGRNEVHTTINEVAKHFGWTWGTAGTALRLLKSKGLLKHAPPSEKWFVPGFLCGDTLGCLIDDLIGGVGADMVEDTKGVMAFAQGCTEGDCCCEDNPNAPPDETSGLQCDDSGTWCMRCQALALIDHIEGREPGSTVLAERKTP